jgi:iron complex outermembrane receptor protein
LSLPQAVAADEASADEPTDSGVLEEIIVTARRRTENLQTTPVSVTALTQQDLEAQKALNISDVARTTPNLLTVPAAATKNTALLSIRGQVQNDALATLDPSVGVYVDDVYMARAYSVLNDLLDVARVEVLEGPQGTLYGRNTTGGAIKVETVKPDPSGPISGFITGSAGNYRSFDGSGAISIPMINDVLAVRYAAAYHWHDGYTHSYLVDEPDLTPVARYDSDDLNSVSQRLTLVFMPIDGLRMELVGSNYHANDNGSLAVNTTGDVENLVAPPPNFAFAFSNSPQRQNDFYSALTFKRPYSFASNSTATLNVRYDIAPNIWTKLIAGYVNADNHSADNASGVVTGSVALVEFDPILNQSQHQVSGEWQLGGDAFDKKLSWITGLYYFKEQAAENSPATTRVFGRVNAVAFIGDVNNNSKSAFGDLTYKLTDRLSATGGVRYTRDSKGLVGMNTDQNDVCIYPAGPGITTSTTPGGTCLLDRTDTFSYTSWEAGMDYQFTDTLYGYVKAGDGFRSGGEQLRAVNAASAAPFQPEKVMNYEGGFKSELLEHRARLNLTYFHTNYTQIQESIILSPPLYPTTTTQIINSGDAKVDGFEAQAELRPINQLTLSAGAGYTNFKFNDPTVQQVYAPKFTGSADAAYTAPVGIGTATMRVGYTFRGKYVVSQDRTVDSELPSSGLLNARLSLDLNAGLSLALYGKNLTDKEYFTNGIHSANLLPAMLGAPRTYGAEVTYRFGK